MNNAKSSAVGTRRFAVWSSQRTGLKAFDARLQRQTAQLFQQRWLLPAAPARHTETHRLTAINALRTTVGSYGQPQRTQRDTPAYNSNRGNSQPRSYNPPPARSYSAPQTYSAPSRGYSAPSGSYSTPSRGYSASVRLFTLHRATARAEEAAVVGVAVRRKARTAAEAPPLAGGTNPFSNSVARPDLPGGPFVFSASN